MTFEEVAPSNANGCILGHSVRMAGAVIKKGTLLTEAHIEQLKSAGVQSIPVAKLGPDDVHEDTAAQLLASAIAGDQVTVDPPLAGRVNLRAAAAGVCLIDADAILAINTVDESITTATLQPFARVARNDLLATIKIIPFATHAKDIQKAISFAQPISVSPFKTTRAVLVTTGQTSPKVIETTERRLNSLGAELCAVETCKHTVNSVAEALLKHAKDPADLTLILGHTATVDRRDVIPSAIESIGGLVNHFGMPVDPGNLLMLATLSNKPLVVMPGCARSPKLNGFDWILERLCAGISVTGNDITRLGVGGLLKEIPTRPLPRETPMSSSSNNIHAVLLAAGASRRMGANNKLTEAVNGKPIVRHAAEALLAAGFPVTAVTGHEADRVQDALSGLDVKIVVAPDWREGMSRSLRAGIAALPDDCSGALIALGDMPFTTPEGLRALASAFNPKEGKLIIVPEADGHRGNPVLFARSFFSSLSAISGDIGGRALIEENRDVVAAVEVPANALVDIDTPEALKVAQTQSGKSEPGR